MKKLGLSLAFSLTPMSAMAAAIVVDAGTTVDGGLINPVQTQQVYGTANNFSIYGNQQVMSGGVANNSNVFSGGQQNISSGGTAHNTNIQASAVQYVYGVANSTNIASQGSSTVNRGGVVNETTINGGTLSVLSGGKALGTILQSGTESVSGTDVGSVINGGVQQVNRNGTVQNTQINGGEQKVLVRGTATGSIISGGVQNVYGDSLSSEIKDNGVMNVYSSGYAENTLMSGGEMNVLSGGFSSGVQISGGVETVYGFDINGTVNGGIQKVEADGQAEDIVIQGSGVQQILSGGYGFNANIKDGGIQIAEQGGYAYRSNVYDGGVLNALGEAYEVTVYDGGVLNVEDGGLAADTQINGGVLTIHQGGTSQNTILASGAENVYGTSNGTQINGGVQNVYGVANSSVLSAGGVLNVEDGGLAADTQINGGVLTIHQGGTSQNTILASGAENVYGTSNGTQINGGVQNVYGVANSSVVASGGEQRVYGDVQSTQVNQSGILTVLSGGNVQNAQLTSGTLNLYSGGTLSGKISAVESVINVYGDNDIANLELDKSLVTMVKGGDYGTLNIENLNGTGIFNISTDLSANQSDTINVQNGDGEFGLWINDYSMDEAPDKYKIIDESTVAHENFYLIGGAVDVGAYQYKLVQEGNDWYLENTEKLNDTTYIAKNTYSTLSSLFYAHLSPVYSRIFEKHKKDRHAGGLWTKAIGRRIEQNFKDGTSSQTDVYGGNIGFDHEVLQDDDYQVRLGVYTSYSHSKQEYNHLGKAEGNTQSYGVYSSLTTKENWFVDVLGAYFTHRQSVNSYTPAGDLVTGKYDTYGWQTTLTAGKRFEFDNDWYLEPHVGVGYMWVNGVRYRTNFNTLIEGSSQDNVKGSVGVNGGKVYQLSEKAKMEVFGKFSLIHDWKSESKVWVADYLMEEDMSSLHYKLGAGVKGSWNENQSAFVEISTHLGSNLDIPYEITLGYQYEF